MSTGNAAELTRLTRLARDTFYDTTLPFPLIDAVTAQMSIARTPTCFWVEDGAFYGFEGCNGASTPHSDAIGGCCPLNCTHVWNYEMALARLFPDLERSMRDTEWDIQQHPSGYLPHRVLLPTYLPRPWGPDDRRPGQPGARRPARRDPQDLPRVPGQRRRCLARARLAGGEAGARSRLGRRTTPGGPA